MPTGFGVNRPRLELTGLEEPDELWERLQEATAQANALATTNKKLASRVRALERRLVEVGALSDDELVAELPRRMSRALESAQGVATEIVRRARKQEASIRQKADESAAAIVRNAEGRAAGILRQAAAEGAARVAAAEAEALDVVASADSRRKQVLAGLEGEAATLRQRIKLLERHQARLVQAYDVVEQTLSEARTVLGRAPSPEAASEPARPEVLPAAANGRSSGRQVPRSPADGAPPGAAVGPAYGVFDWSPPVSQAG